MLVPHRQPDRAIRGQKCRRLDQRQQRRGERELALRPPCGLREECRRRPRIERAAFVDGRGLVLVVFLVHLAPSEMVCAAKFTVLCGAKSRPGGQRSPSLPSPASGEGHTASRLWVMSRTPARRKIDIPLGRE